MEFNFNQREFIKCFLKKKNIFLTGIAGTGKTYVLQKIIDWSKDKNTKIGITAMTGAAAILLNGITIHSWAGIGIGDKPINFYIDKINKFWELKKRWIYTKILIIDEISMMDINLFNLLDSIGKIIRNNNKPFGGLQIILCGDFFQLPPITKNNSTINFCFESDLFDSSIDNYINLTENMRQKDNIFQNCLKEIRVGKCSKETEEILNKCINKTNDNIVKPTKLFTLRSSVDKINEQELNNLDEKIFIYNIKSKIINKCNFTKYEIDNFTNNFDKNNQYEKKLYLAKNAQVMLIKNLDFEKGLVNGSRGIIVDFVNNNPVVLFVNGIKQEISRIEWEFEIDNKGKIIRQQIPLILAWAVTIHKSQGSTLDCVELDIGKNIFEYGQSYVALSRVRNLEGLYINKLDVKKIKAHPKVKKFYKDLEKKL